jgi:hypothetical protein
MKESDANKEVDGMVGKGADTEVESADMIVYSELLAEIEAKDLVIKKLDARVTDADYRSKQSGRANEALYLSNQIFKDKLNSETNSKDNMYNMWVNSDKKAQKLLGENRRIADMLMEIKINNDPKTFNWKLVRVAAVCLFVGITIGKLV